MVAAARGWGGRGAVAVGGYHGGYYHAGGCYGCGAAAGAVAGLAVGAAIASSARPTTVVVNQPAYYPAVSPYYPQGNLVIGTQVAYLPPGSNSMVVNGVNYYQSGPTWYKPYYGSSGVYYEVFCSLTSLNRKKQNARDWKIHCMDRNADGRRGRRRRHTGTVARNRHRGATHQHRRGDLFGSGLVAGRPRDVLPDTARLSVISYDIFLNLEVAGSQDLFRSDAISDRYGLITQAPNPRTNPDGLPIGLTKTVINDGRWKGEMGGWSCAACHNAQLTYKGKKIRIDGGFNHTFDFMSYLFALDDANAVNVD